MYKVVTDFVIGRTIILQKENYPGSRYEQVFEGTQNESLDYIEERFEYVVLKNINNDYDCILVKGDQSYNSPPYYAIFGGTEEECQDYISEHC